MTRVLGIDPSLTSTGLCSVLNVGWPGVISGSNTSRNVLIQCHTVTSKPTTDKSYRAVSDRLAIIVEAIAHHLIGVDLVVIEGPSYASKFGHTHTRDWLWGRIFDLCVRDYHVPVMVASPTQRMKYATGKGNANKDAVLAAVIKRWPNIDITGNDTADALVLAAIGCRSLDLPIDEVPQSHWQTVMAKLAS